MSSRFPTGRLLVVLLSFLAALLASAPSLDLPWLFRPFMSAPAYQRYCQRKLAYGLDLEGGLDLVYRVGSQRPEEIKATVEILRNRIDLFGVAGASVQLQADDQVRIQVPGADPGKQQRIKGVLDTTDLLTMHRVLGEASEPLGLDAAEGQVVLPESVPRDPAGEPVRPPSWFLLVAEPEVRGDALAGARVGLDPMTGDPRIEAQMNPEGAKRFAAVSARMIGSRLAIVLAGKVYMAPTMIHEVPDGHAVIVGRFDIEEARTVTSILQAGALPAKLEKLAETTVGPSLGGDSVARGLAACRVGGLLVLAYLAWFYRLAGVLAGAGQVLNLLLVVSGLWFFDAALTLPGIAGLALSVGMAVDANIIVNERIKEELWGGKKARLAIEHGFERAFAAVFDGNATTLLTCAVLYLLGSGPVKGFAVTLGLGLMASMYSALFVVRTLLDAVSEAGGGATLGIGAEGGPPRNGRGFRFMEKRRGAYLASLAGALVSLAALGCGGLRWGTEFTGGQVYRYGFADPARATVEAVRARLAAPGLRERLGPVVVQEVRAPDRVAAGAGPAPVEYLVFARAPAAGGASADLTARLDAALGELGGATRLSSLEVGPSLGAAVTRQAALAVALGSLLVLAYMAVRFELRWGLCAVLALLHDALLVLGVMALLGREMTADTLAALLTIIGYSVNDTIIVMDRVRENLRLPSAKGLGSAALFDLSINQTLTRTLNTSFTTLIPIAAFLLLGGPVIADFALAMGVGIVSGTWSTVFVVGALLVDWELRDRGGERAPAPGSAG